jgi:hypothetical protein
MRLKDVAKVAVNMEDADFWIIRRGSIENVGKPVKTFDQERIGVKVERTDIVLPDFLFYAIEYIWMRGSFKSLSTGTTNLVNIRVEDIKNIQFGGRE